MQPSRKLWYSKEDKNIAMKKMSKLKFPLLLTWISAIPLVIAVEWLIKPGLLNGILIPMAACFYAVLMAEIGLVLNLKIPNLHWTSEIIPLKQSAPVTIALLGGWLVIVALAGIYVLLRNVVSVTVFGILPDITTHCATADSVLQ